MDNNFEKSKVDREYNSYYEGPHYLFADEKNPVDLSASTDAVDASLVDLPFPHNGSYLEYDADAQVYNYFEYGKAHLRSGQ